MIFKIVLDRLFISYDGSHWTTVLSLDEKRAAGLVEMLNEYIASKEGPNDRDK